MHHRLLPLDRLRGLVIVLMTVDHASGAFNRGRLVRDAAAMVKPGEVLDPAQFLLRWITHLCAPTFLFLAGAALALSVARRQARGVSAGAIDRDLAIRGLLILALDPLWVSRFWAGDAILLQVLYGIGATFLLLVPLRRLPPAGALAVGLTLVVGGEALAGGVLALSGGKPALPGALLVHGGFFDGLIVAYPALPWLAVALLGWWWGHRLDRTGAPPDRTARELALAGLASLAVFGVVRGLDGYGNLLLYRGGTDLVSWLHVSKYPPSVTYVTLELGLMALLLAAFFALEPRRQPADPRAPLLIWGQTALFFYVLHIPLLELVSHATGLHRAGGIGLTLAAAALTLAALTLPCVAYRAYKAAHPTSWARFL
ncbi:MAG: DUF1624 domain-containing protein [Alphaproteobacteria bacterium]|nr:DUF1624 domain-containing protein [Alphaproteobacteria bacterium]